MKRRTLLTLAAAAMLSACGFQLRGSNGQTALPFKTIYVGFPETSPLGTELKRHIRASGDTDVVTDPTAAQVILDVLSESREKAVLSKNTQGRVREYSLYYKLRFRVRDNKNNELLAPTDIILKRDISFNESQVMAKENEEALLYRDMQSDLVQQMLRRLQVLRLA
ncbi:MAG TPA: LPS assembly lipoprotein LptE [Noviherbaspirillum sp.]|nr:LPS assembly lipoprotein LptE [Noviherbaspirillum sp.]